MESGVLFEERFFALLISVLPLISGLSPTFWVVLAPKVEVLVIQESWPLMGPIILVWKTLLQAELSVARVRHLALSILKEGFGY